MRVAHEVRRAEDLRCDRHVAHADGVDQRVPARVARHPRVEAAHARGVGDARRARVVPDGVLLVRPVVEEVVAVPARRVLVVGAGE